MFDSGDGDDFWIILNYILDGENHDVILNGFILIFHSLGRVFPRPQLYDIIQDPDPESLYLPAQFWKEAEIFGR